MSPPSTRRDVVAWGLLLATSCLYFFSTNDADPDLWGHVFFGRHILATGAPPATDPYAYTSGGHPWIDHEWLAQVFLAVAYAAAGAPGLLLLKLIVGAATLGMVLWTLWPRTERPWMWGSVGLLVTAVAARGFAFRPQIFTYLATAITLALIEAYQRGYRRALWACPVLFALWVNLHAGFVVGVGILVLFAISEWLREPTRAPRLMGVLLASLGAIAVNPYGPRLVLYIGNELRRPHPITEWQPAAVTDAGQFAFFVMLGLFIATLPCARDWRTRGWEILLALSAAALALRHQRHTPVFALCAGAPLAAQLRYTATWLGERSPVALGLAAHRAVAAAVIGLAATQVLLTALRLRDDGLAIVFDSADYPISAVRVLERATVHANLAVPLEWGEYALWFVAPHVKVSLDGRFATVFSERVVADNFDFFAGTSGWRRLIDEYPTDAALVPRDSPCPIATLPDWRLVHDDPVARVYARAGSATWRELERVSNLTPQPRRMGVFP